MPAWSLSTSTKVNLCVVSWIPIGASSARNYDYGAWLKGIERTDKIRITNTGTESLFVDAIIGGRSIH